MTEVYKVTPIESFCLKIKKATVMLNTTQTPHRGEEQPRSLPVIQSLFSGDALMSEVLVDYDIEHLGDCKLLAHNLSDNYLVRTAENKYILRIYQAPRRIGHSWRSEADILYELDLLLHLHRKGVAVSIPLARKDGIFMRTLQAPEGPRPAVLFTYAPGDPVTPPKQNNTLSRLYGHAIAEIHAASDDFVSSHSRFHLDLAFLLDRSLQTIQPVLAQRPDNWAYLVQLADFLKKQIGLLAPQKLDMGACHGDAQGGNAHIAGGKMLTFFDFDVCGHGWRAYDLAVFYWGAALGKSRLGWDDKQVEHVWVSYLEGYQERRPLSDLDLQAVPLFVAVRHFWFLGLHTANWDYWGWSEVDDHFFERELTFLREWVTQQIERA